MMAFVAQMFLSKGNDLYSLKNLFFESMARKKHHQVQPIINSSDFSSVAFMSGAALLLAKIALLFSALVNTQTSFLLFPSHEFG
jgi:hypothetical protein